MKHSNNQSSSAQKLYDEDAHVHPHDHDHPHTHDHEHEYSFWAKTRHFFQPHVHSHFVQVSDPAISTQQGIRAVKISLVVLLITAFFQVGIVSISGSVALLADTVHNFSDALTAIPLGLAFALSRLPRSRRYTYGYGRAEDIAGVIIVLMIFASAIVVFQQSINKILNSVVIENIGWVAAASVIGFVGNELVAIFRINTGQRIGSAALVADGMHARVDGLTSLGVLIGAIGVWLGFPLADPIIGLLIGVSILIIVWGSAKDMWFRLMDAAEPEAVAQLEKLAKSTQGVLEVHNIRLRWVGHKQVGEMDITVDCELPTHVSHAIAESVRHRLFHNIPSLSELIIHVDPCECQPKVDYHPTRHHFNIQMEASHN